MLVYLPLPEVRLDIIKKKYMRMIVGTYIFNIKFCFEWDEIPHI